MNALAGRSSGSGLSSLASTTLLTLPEASVSCLAVESVVQFPSTTNYMAERQSHELDVSLQPSDSHLVVDSALLTRKSDGLAKRVTTSWAGWFLWPRVSSRFVSGRVGAHLLGERDD
ncbi:hypothetical protein KCU65_g124, partial [Aureobasidium melanogenum]